MAKKTFMFSGSCFSGKTTAMEWLAECLKEEKGTSVTICSEEIRKYLSPADSIDEVRKDAEKYFLFEKNMIMLKILSELEAFSSSQSDKICFFDRSVIDSLYYYSSIKFQAGTEFFEKHEKFKKLIEAYVPFMADNVTKIFLFSPLERKDNTDPLRPRDLESAKRSEYQKIKAMTEAAFCTPALKKKIISIDMNKIQTPAQKQELKERLFDEILFS